MLFAYCRKQLMDIVVCARPSSSSSSSAVTTTTTRALRHLEWTIREGCARYNDWGSDARPLHEKTFWDTFYEGKRGTSEEDDFEWFVDAAAAAEFVRDTITPEHRRLLHVGAGTSKLGPILMATERHGIPLEVVNCDNSETAVEVMCNAFPELDWHLLDLADIGDTVSGLMPHPWDSTFDVIIDKGALDAVLFGGPDLTAKFLFGCARMLKISASSSFSTEEIEMQKKSGGIWIQISADPPERRLELLRAVLPEGWRVRFEKVRPVAEHDMMGIDQPSLFEQEHWGYVISTGTVFE